MFLFILYTILNTFLGSKQTKDGLFESFKSHRDQDTVHSKETEILSQMVTYGLGCSDPTCML